MSQNLSGLVTVNHIFLVQSLKGPKLVGSLQSYKQL